MEDLFLIVLRQAFEYDKIIFWFLNSNDVNDLIFESNFEGKNLLANLTVNFVEF